MLPEMRPSHIPLPAPLRSTPVTALRRYYERSDSCTGGSSAQPEHEHRLTPAQVSLRPVPRRCHHSVSTHPTCPVAAFPRYPSALDGSRLAGRLRFRLSRAGSSLTSGRIEFVSYGLVAHLRLLPTPPRSDAVTIGFRPESVCLKRTCTSLTSHHCRRTRAGHGRRWRVSA